MRNTTFNWASAATLAYLSVQCASAAEPAQIPLSSRVAEPPIPNVALTIDDSGSMLADFMPEGTFEVNGKPVTLSRTANNEWVGGFPADWRKLCQVGTKNCVPGQWPTGTFLTGVAAAQKSPEHVYQMHYRSPETNAIFYNPDVLYSPWFKPDGTRLPNADPKAAPYDPMVTNGTFNLSINYTADSGENAKILTNWFLRSDSTSRSAREFYPGLVYRLTAGADPSSMSSFKAYDVNAKDGTHAADTKHPNRTDCANTKCTQAEELQNFANWFTYYRMRETLTKAAVSESFTSFKDKLRVSWGRINNFTEANIDGSRNTYSVIETEARGGPLRLLDADRLASVIGGVHKYASWGGTPLRTAMNAVGAYFDRSLDPVGSPWLTDPRQGSSNKEKLTCRRSVSLVMTDGYYNDSFSAVGDIDGNQGPDYGDANPNGYSPTRYDPVRPYIDGYARTLADVAMKYFVSDLETNIENKVPPLTGDIAFWQHLTQFTVGLGVRGTLDSSTPAAKTATLKALTAGDTKWPDPAAGNPQKIDDMWHAAVNTGGDFYSVRNVTELTAALKDAFGRSAGNEAKEAGIATASSHITADNVKYVPKYKSISWWGDLEAWPLGVDGREGDTIMWRASEQVPPHDKRNLFTWSGKEPVEFRWDSMDATTQNLVGAKELASYIRGDDSNTGSGGTYRARDGKFLGDFVNSPPVLVKGNVDLGYTAFDASYSAYVTAKRSRTNGLVFAGSNDGMLHAFRSSDGAEVFGYLPREGLSRLKLVGAKDYGTPANYHRFFVDGPLNETDAFITPRGASAPKWTNMVIGSMGAGGKTFFALHVPTEFGATLDAADMPANAILWENSGETDGDIGYMFADFAVGKLKNGGWRAFVGNGVYSKNGAAVLLVVNLETGAIEHRLTVGQAGDNGLMGVTLIKDVATHEVVGAYAGDLKGSLWRFDFDGNDNAEVGFNGSPLFRATASDGAAQPITIAPSMVLHPEYGRVVLFGTGRLIDAADADSAAQQTFYGVWDKVRVGESSASAVNEFDGFDPDRSKLQAQTTTTDLVDNKYLTVTATPVDWKSQYGWYMDLPFSRQRVLHPSFILADKYVLFSTSVPAAEAAVCSTNAGVGYNYLLSAADGMLPTTPSFDTNGDGIIDERDTIVGGFQTGNDGRDSVIDAGDGQDSPCVDGFRKYQDCSSGKQCEWIQLPCTADGGTVRDRLWKHILNPPIPAK
jgi:type IV pilus assembly protein PilY1